MGQQNSPGAGWEIRKLDMNFTAGESMNLGTKPLVDRYNAVGRGIPFGIENDRYVPRRVHGPAHPCVSRCPRWGILSTVKLICNRQRMAPLRSVSHVNQHKLAVARHIVMMQESCRVVNRFPFVVCRSQLTAHPRKVVVCHTR